MVSPDARTVSVVRSGLALAADAIGITTIRAAYSTTIKGGADVSGGLFDVSGRLVALSDASMIGHLAPLRSAVRSVLDDFPLGKIGPGDVFIMNDPYRGGVHANDMQVFSPIFVENRFRYMAGAMVHVADVGGTAPGGLSGTVTDMFQEGLTLPPVRLFRQGRPVTDTFNIIAANTRTPDVTLGDVRALVAGTRIGARHLLDVVARLGKEGPEMVEGCVEALLDQTEERTRIKIRELGTGTAQGEAVIDDDGVILDRPLWVRVTLTIRGTAMVIDFTGTDAQAAGPISAPEGPAVSAAVYGARALLDDPDIPVNEGMFRPLSIIRPEGSLVAPRRPAGANARGITMLAMIDAMVDAMARMHPDRAMAGCDLNHVLTLSMTDHFGRTRSFHDRDYGGAGARAGAPGVDAHGYAVFAGRSNVVPMELHRGGASGGLRVPAPATGLRGPGLLAGRARGGEAAAGPRSGQPHRPHGQDRPPSPGHRRR